MQDDERNNDLTNIDDGQIKEGQSLVPKLSQDDQPSYGPPTDPVTDASSDVDVRIDQGRLDPTHQATDNATDIDSHQLYDEGLSGAAEAAEPNAGNTVVGYDPGQDQRNAG